MERYWNYRIMVREYLHKYYFSIYEVCYTKENKPKAHSKYSATIEGNTMDDLQFTLSEMKNCLNEPILWLGDKFPQEFNYDKEMKK